MVNQDVDLVLDNLFRSGMMGEASTCEADDIAGHMALDFIRVALESYEGTVPKFPQ
jgi:hypothetical protein